MKKGFVVTRNFRLMAEADKALKSRGAKEAGLMIIKGLYGVGKSETVERWASEPQNQALFLRAMETWTQRGLLDALAKVMGLDQGGRNSEVQARIIGRLATSMATLVFDEADHLISKNSTKLIETVRDITDMTGCSCLLVGMEGFVRLVAKHGHIGSRVARIVEFQPLDLTDVREVCAKKCEVALATEVVSALAEQCKGRMRLLLNGIAALEELAKANSLAKVELQHIAGRKLCDEFAGDEYKRHRSN